MDKKKSEEKEELKEEVKEEINEEIKEDDKQNELNSLKATIIDLDSKLKYQQAELINYRKRKDEEVANMLKFANKDLILELLPVADNFERAIKLDEKNENPEVSKFMAGFKILYTTLINTLNNYGVQEIETIGKSFDPLLHEAMMVQNDANKEDDEILDCVLKGYTLKGKVIRPAKVIVNKKD